MDIDWIVLAAPASAILVALITTVFNIYDARKRLKLENNRMQNQSIEVFLRETDFVADKYRATKFILLECTNMKHTCRVAAIWEAHPPKNQDIRKFVDEIETSLEAIRILVASDQASLSIKTHEEYNTRTLPNIQKQLLAIEGGSPQPSACVKKISGTVTDFKRYVATELQSAVFNSAS